MEKSTLVENLKRQGLTLNARSEACDRMLSGVDSLLYFMDDHDTGTNYVKTLFNTADAINYYAKLEMSLGACLEELATLMKESAQELSQAEGECNEPQH